MRSIPAMCIRMQVGRQRRHVHLHCSAMGKGLRGADRPLSGHVVQQAPCSA